MPDAIIELLVTEVAIDKLGARGIATHDARHHRLGSSPRERKLLKHRLGHLEPLYDDPVAAIREQVYGGYHQAGTTRMSARPEDGVLDRDLAVHGFRDLFVASSSAFVTSSQANTTS